MEAHSMQQTAYPCDNCFVQEVSDEFFPRATCSLNEYRRIGWRNFRSDVR